MKLYIITIDDVFDFEGFHTSPIVRTSEKEARKELNRLFRSAKETLKDALGSSMAIEKSKDCFDIYYDGSWSNTHYAAVINCIEVPNIQKVTELCG